MANLSRAAALIGAVALPGYVSSQENNLEPGGMSGEQYYQIISCAAENLPA
ncbi:MAG: hypothetical protein WD601_13990 [Pseudohongiellaceae bacterium]